MKNNTITTVCIATGVVALGIGGLIFGMRTDKNTQESGKKVVALHTPTKVTQDNTKKENDVTNESEPVVNKTETDKTENVNSAACYIQLDNQKLKVDYSGDVNDKNLEISKDVAIDIGVKYIEDEEGHQPKINSVQLSKSNLSGIRNGTTTWNASFTYGNEVKEVVIDAQNGEILTQSDYEMEDVLASIASVNKSGKENEKKYIKQESDIKAFDTINVEICSADVEIVSGDKYGIKYVYGSKGNRITHTNKNGKLTVKSHNKKQNKSKVNSYVIITVPKKAKLSKSDLSVTSGDITLDKLNCNNIDVACCSGDVGVKNTSYNQMNLSVTSGDVVINGDLSNTTNCDVVSGDISMSCKGKKNNYSYDLTCTSGDITVDGKTNEKNVYVNNNSKNKITVNTVSGDVNLSFK